MRQAHMKVVLVKPSGLVATWNEGVEKSINKVRAGDLIEMINGVGRSAKDMLEVMKEKSVLTMIMRRPTHFGVNLQRVPGKPLGIKLAKEVDAFLIVSVDDEGMVADWNQENLGKAISSGDRVVEANGFCGIADQIMAVMMIDDVLLELVVARC
mmetsp:Transcript_90256/g.258271  ORF Transcript_90256/g.258271 Transcript_90256/m.258271 type:complete len:154 (+) Transcript_90256:2-463(+)